MKSFGRFFLAHTPESMTRLIAFCCGLSGCALALIHPQSWQTVTALIGGGSVALLTRSTPPIQNGGAGVPSEDNSK